MRSPEEVWADQGPEQPPADHKDPWAIWGLNREDHIQPERTLGGTLKDVGVTALKSAVALPEAVVGVADLVTGGKAGKLAEEAGVRFKDANAILDEQYSPAQKFANKKVDEAGKDETTLTGKVWEKTKAAVKNPSTIAQAVGESAASIVGGGAVARGAVKWLPQLRTLAASGVEGAQKAGIIGGAIGEGAMSAGSTAEQVRQETKGGELTLAQSAIAGGSGLLTGLLNLGGGKLAKRFGWADADSLLAGVDTAGKKNIARRILEGAAAEGLIEEFPQSAQEQIAQNIATGKAWDDGLDKAIAMGTLAGAAMGAGANMRPEAKGPVPSPTPAQQPPGQPPVQPAGPTQAQRLAQQAYVQVKGAGQAVQQVQSLRANIASTLAGLPQQQQNTAIAHLSGGNEALAEQMFNDLQDEELQAQAAEAPLLDDAGTGALEIAETIRKDAGLLEDQAVTPATPTKVADTIEQTAQTSVPVNSAGWVPEPVPQVQAQVDAVRQGRKNAAYTDEETFKQIDVTGLHYGRARGADGKVGVVIAQDPALIEQMVTLAAEIGLDPAAGKVLGYVNPTLSSAPQPGAAVIQQVDNQTGHILKSEAVMPEEAGQVDRIPDTTLNFTTADQEIAQRVAQQGQAMPESPSTGPAAAAPSFNGGMRAEPTPVITDDAEETDETRVLTDRINSDRGVKLAAGSIRAVKTVPHELKQMARAIKMATNTKVVYVTTDEDFWGVSLGDKNTIYMNVKSASPLMTLGHELVHVLEEQHPDLYIALAEVVLKRISVARAKKLKAALENAAKTEDSDAAINALKAELVAEAIGELAQNESFWMDAYAAIAKAAKKPGVWDEFIQSVKAVLQKLHRAFIGQGYLKGAKDIASVQKAFNKALVEWHKRIEPELAAEQIAIDEAKKKSEREQFEKERVKPVGGVDDIPGELGERARKLMEGVKKVYPDMVKAISFSLVTDHKNGKLEKTLDFREDWLRKEQAAREKKSEERPKVTPQKVSLSEEQGTPALPQPILDAALKKLTDIAAKLGELGFHPGEARKMGVQGEARTLDDAFTALGNALAGLAGRRYQDAAGTKKSPDHLKRAEDYASELLGIDTRKYPGVKTNRKISVHGNWQSEEVPQTVQELLASTRRYGSGMSSISDLENGAYATMNLETRGIGVVAGELSAKAIDALADASVNRNVAVFVDSGAFGAYMKGKPVDFEKVLATYDRIEEAIGSINEPEGNQIDFDSDDITPEDYYGRRGEEKEVRPLLVVMPDVVGDQKASIALIEKHRQWVSAQSLNRRMRPIIPIQKGELPLAEAYEQVKKIIGHDRFIVGVPSNKEAISAEEFTQFLKDAKPKAVHILGAAADSKLMPRLQSIVDSGLAGKIEVTADSSKMRSIGMDVAAGKGTREELIQKKLGNPEDPHVKRMEAPTEEGVDAAGLKKLEEAFQNAEKSQIDDDFQVTHVFDPPKNDEIVRLAKTAGVKEIKKGKGKTIYHREAGWMTPAEAKAKIAEWKKHAEEQGETSENSEKIVLSLFDLTGKWSEPWERAGYQVFRFDIQDESTYEDPETGEEKLVGDVNNFSTSYFNDLFGSFDGNDVYAILAAVPCTDFASAGAKHFAIKDAAGTTVESVKLVQMTKATVEYFKPMVWAIENPVGRIESLGNLPPWRLSFDPYQLGDPYTKKTMLWGRFNADLPVAPVFPSEGSKMHSQYGGKSQKTKNARSETPEGFAYAFFMANNAKDHPVMAVANKYDRLDRKLIQQAIEAGVTPQEIDEAVQDHYYFSLDDEAGNKALRGLAEGKSASRDDKVAQRDAIAQRIADKLGMEKVDDSDWNRDLSGGEDAGIGMRARFDMHGEPTFHITYEPPLDDPEEPKTLAAKSEGEAVKVLQGWVKHHEAKYAPKKPDAKPKKPAGGRNARSAAQDRNPFKDFLGKHGIKLELAKEFVPGKKEQQAAMAPGRGPIFKKTGLNIDMLAERAVEEGFLLTEDTTELYDMIRRALAGERIIAQYAEGAAEREMQQRISRQQELQAEDAFDGLSTYEAAVTDALLDDDDIPWDTPSNTSTAEAMTAMGFTEEEINEAVAAEESGIPPQDSAGRGGADEAPQAEGQGDHAQAPAEAAGQVVARLQAEYDKAKAALDALGPEPRNPGNEKRAFGNRGRAGALPQEVARYDEAVKAHASWRRKYSKLKKAEVEASNALFRAKQAAEAERIGLPMPWTLTQDEFVKRVTFSKDGNSSNPWTARWGDTQLEAGNEEFDHPDLGKTVVQGGRFFKTKREAEIAARGAHKRGVRRAALNGEKIEPRVLEAYPDLQMREVITPAEDTQIGMNDAGEPLYERKDGSRYRMHNGRPDFGGDLAPVSELTSPTPEEILAAQKRAEEADKAAAKADKDAENKAKADAQVNEYVLTGSDRPADANPNQKTLLQRIPSLHKALRAAIAVEKRFRAFDRKTSFTDAEGETYFTLAGKLGDAEKVLAQELADLPDDGFSIAAKTKDGRQLILNASAQRPGKWQLTRFDKKGEPWGDTQFDKKLQATKELVSEADLSTLETLDGPILAAPPTHLQRNPLKMAKTHEVLEFGRTGKLPLDLLAAYDRGEYKTAVQLAKNPQQREKAIRRIMDKAIQALADSLVPVKRWIDSLPLSDNLKQRLTGDLYRADTLRAGMQKEVAEQFTKRMFDAIDKAAKATKMSTDEVKTWAGFWMTAKYAPKANALLISKDRAVLNAEIAREQQAQIDKSAAEAILNAPAGTHSAQQRQAAGRQLARANTIIALAPARIAEAQQNLNDRLADVNAGIRAPGQNAKRGLGGGMTNAEAAQFVRNAEAKIDPALLKEIAQPIYDLMQWKKATDLSTGKVTKDMVLSWPNHPDYVPLSGDPRATSEDSDLFDGGNQLNQSKDEAMNGRKTSVADNAIDAAFAATIKSINFAAIQDFKRTLMKTYTQATQQGHNIGLKLEAVSGIMRQNDDVVIYRDSFTTPTGQTEHRAYAFRFADDRITEAIKKDNVEQVNVALEIIGKPTRLYARAVTQFMPMFAPINMVRDIWERSELLRTRKLFASNGAQIDVDKVARRSIAGTLDFNNWRATWAKAWKNGKMSPARGELEEMIRLGGSSVWGDFLSRRQQDLEAEIRRHGSAWGKMTAKVNKVAEGYNTAFELIPALSIYRSLKAEGMVAEDAAAATLDLMNFKKKGAIMPALRAFYIFAQPAATSGYNLAQYLATKKGRVRFFAQVVIGVGLYSLLRAMWGDDDDEDIGNRLDNLGNYTVERSIPLNLGGIVVKVPVGFGPPQLSWATAVNLVRMAHGRYNPGEALLETGKSWLKAAAPVAPSDIELTKRPVDWLMQTFTPTVLRPLVQMGQDQTAFGGPLTPQFKDNKKMRWQQAKRTTSSFYSDVAKEIADLTGIDIYPDQIKHLADSYMVDPATRILRQALIDNPARKERGEPGQLVGVSSLIDSVNDRQLLNTAYYRVREEAQDAFRKYNSDPEQYEELRDRAMAFKRFETAEKLISQRRTQLKKMRDNLDEDTLADRTQRIEEDSDEAHRKLLREYIGQR